MTRDDDPLNPDQSAAEADGEVYVVEVDPECAGQRLDKCLSTAIDALTRTRLKALIEAGAVSRNGQVAGDPSVKVREGDVLSVTAPPAADPEPEGEAIPLDVVYEDDDLIIVNKPAGMVVHPAAGNWSGTLVNALIYHCGESLSGIGGVARPGIVHRLDKDTSGLLVAAKNDAAHQGLTKAFSKHNIERVYEAIAAGAPRPGIGAIDAPIARAPSDRKKMAVAKDPMRAEARHAVTHYKLINSFGRRRAKLPGDAVASHLECRLETGRTHQIRVHLASIGHPLIGDPLYGRGPGLSGLKPGEAETDRAIAYIKGFRRQALHARVLGFAHPITKDPMRFERPAPADFQELLAVLQKI